MEEQLLVRSLPLTALQEPIVVKLIEKILDVAYFEYRFCII